MIHKTKFGDLDVEDKQIIIFDNGLPGFSNLRKFILLARENDYPIHWLVSLENEFVAFPIVNPWLICVDYTVNLSDLDIQELAIESQSDLNIWAIMTIPKDDPTQATVN
ncbi:MAG: flagellar assembly protein FliW, partial [Pseudothermotoga sp.]